MMENPSRLEENMEVLSHEIATIYSLLDEENNPLTNEFVTKLEVISIQFSELKNEYDELDKPSMNVRHRLNQKVNCILKSIRALKKVGNTALNSVETLFSDLPGAKPNQFTLANLTSFTDNFSMAMHNDLNGNLYLGQFPNGLPIVVKVLTGKLGVEQTFVAELITMAKTSHRNLVKLYGFCFESRMKAYVFEHVPNGSLDNILYDNHHAVEWEKLYCIAIEIARGLSYLHDGCDHPVIHHDLMPSNVLLDWNFSPKITKFGGSKVMHREFTQLTGNPTYEAPEATMEYSDITSKCNVYSFGMMLIEILGRRENIQGDIIFSRYVWDKFEKGQIEEIMNECGIEEKNTQKTKLLCMVAFWCIQYTPENRPSMSSVVKMLEKEIQVLTPPDPFVTCSGSSAKSFQEAVY